MGNIAVCGFCVYMWALYVMCAYWYEWALLGVCGHCGMCMEIVRYVGVFFDYVLCMGLYFCKSIVVYVGYCICAHWCVWAYCWEYVCPLLREVCGHYCVCGHCWVWTLLSVWGYCCVHMWALFGMCPLVYVGILGCVWALCLCNVVCICIVDCVRIVGCVWTLLYVYAFWGVCLWSLLYVLLCVCVCIVGSQLCCSQGSPSSVLRGAVMRGRAVWASLSLWPQC